MKKECRDHLLVGFDECSLVLLHEDTFTVEHASYPGAEEIRGRRGVQLIDGEPHRVLHAFLTRYFSSQVERLRVSRIRPLVAAAIAECSGQEEIEILHQLAAPLSLRVIAAVLGLPHEEREFIDAFADWRDSMTPWVATHGEGTAERERAIEAARRLRSMVLPTIREHQRPREEDLLSALWQVGPRVFADWSEDDVFDQCRIMLLAGSDGVARLIATTVHLALDAATLRDGLVTGTSGHASDLVELACRLFPPAQLRSRIAERAVQVGERRVKPGDRVRLDVVEANRDPAHFQPGQAATRQHLAFNIGSRYCAGAPLARAEATETVKAFFRAFPRCERMAGRAAAEFTGHLFVGFSPVHVRLQDGETRPRATRP